MNLDYLIQLDQRVSLWLNSLHSPAWDNFWLLLSDVRIWFPAYGMIMAFIVWKLGWKKGVPVVLSLIAGVVLTDQISTDIKYGLERLRPCYNAWMVSGGVHFPFGHAGGFFGFFSSHASNTFGFAVTSYYGLKWNGKPQTFKIYGWCVFIWAILVSLSRVMMAAHFLGDVLVGILFGVAIGFAVAGITRLIIVKAKL